MVGRWEGTARTCTYVLFGLTEASVLSNPVWSDGDRNLHVFEVWSGAAAVQRAPLACRFTAEAFDIKNSKSEDILSEDGFHLAVQKVTRLRPGGLLAMAPVCSSFVGLNAVNTKRSKRSVSGDTSYRPAKEGNSLHKLQPSYCVWQQLVECTFILRIHPHR